jgi:TRAP transporter TAXI family solute receptor
MSKKVIHLLCVVAAVILTFNTAIAGEPVHLKFASFKMGSGWYVMGATIVDLLKKQLPSGSTVDLLPHSGGVGNAVLISKKDAQMGLGVNVTNQWAYEGRVAYKEKMTSLRGLVGGMDTYWLAVMLTAKTPITSFQEIIDKKYPLKLMLLPKGSLGAYGAFQIMEAYGISEKDIKSWGGSITQTSFGAIVSAMKDGRANAFIQVITPGHPSVTELATTTGLRFLSLREDVINKLAATGWDRSIMPAGTFKGQDEAVRTTGFTTTLITTEEFPEDLAYLVTKIVCENKDALVKAYAGMKVFDPATAWKPDKVGIPLHVGALKYYKEKGWMK